MDSRFPSITPPAELCASWARSRAHGLTEEQSLPEDVIRGAELADRFEANARLLTFSRPVIENLYQQIGSPSSTVLLADRDGMILSAVGDTRFLDRAARVALAPGARWDEATMGTNAIGTSLHTGSIVAVEGDEHYLARNRFLSCIATPILAPTGGILGIVDVSTDARGDIAHADALLRTTAELIEHRLVESLDEGFLTVRFHHRPDLLGTPLEALTVFDEGGSLLASNRAARGLLRLHEQYPSASCEELFAVRWSGLVAWAALRQPRPFPLRAAAGATLAARATLRERRAAESRRRGTGRSRSHLAAMLLGDRRIAAAVATLERRAGRRGPLLVEGEMGSGKTHLVQAFHRDTLAGPGAPLVTIDCTTVGSGEGAAAEVLGALQQASGGTLLLKEIGALAPSLQGNLMRATTEPGRARVVATTTRTMAELVRTSRFPLLAFENCGGEALALPPLRERTDFDALVRLFIREAYPSRPIYVCPDALALLRRHRWPGNLRELRNQLRLILALVGDETNRLCPEDIPSELFEDDEPLAG